MVIDRRVNLYTVDALHILFDNRKLFEYCVLLKLLLCDSIDLLRPCYVGASVIIEERVVEANRNAPPDRVDGADGCAQIHDDQVADFRVRAALPAGDHIAVFRKLIILPGTAR